MRFAAARRECAPRRRRRSGKPMIMRLAKASLFMFVVGAPALSTPRAWAEDTHAVTVTKASVPVGQAASVGVTIEGRNGWHINAEAPVSLKLTATEGVTVEKPALGRGDLVESTEQRARFDVRATPAAAGEITIAAEASFVMCQETACKPVREKLTLKVAAASDDATKPSGKTKAKRPPQKS